MNPGKRESGRVPKWMTPELIQQTVRVWSAEIGRHIAEREAVEILRSVKRLAEITRRRGLYEA